VVVHEERHGLLAETATQEKLSIDLGRDNHRATHPSPWVIALGPLISQAFSSFGITAAGLEIRSVQTDQEGRGVDGEYTQIF
jgi:hypothetical protein